MNKYKKIYDQIIEHALEANRSKKQGYFEEHHIQPKSLGGSNLKENRVLLTAREHFICHKCLVRFLSGSDQVKMVHALMRLINGKTGLVITNRDYEVIRKAHAAAVSKQMKGRNVSEEAKLNMSIAQKKRFETEPGVFTGRTHIPATKERMSQKQRGSNNPQFGKSRTTEDKIKISKKLKGHKKSPETVEKFRARTWSDEKKKQIAEGMRKYHERKRAAKQIEMGCEIYESGEGGFDLES